MPLQYTKITVAILWVLAIGIVGMAANVRSVSGLILLAAISLLPPIMMMALWKDPPASMTERIREGRR